MKKHWMDGLSGRAKNCIRNFNQKGGCVFNERALLRKINEGVFHPMWVMNLGDSTYTEILNWLNSRSEEKAEGLAGMHKWNPSCKMWRFPKWLNSVEREKISKTTDTILWDHYGVFKRHNADIFFTQPYINDGVKEIAETWANSQMATITNFIKGAPWSKSAYYIEFSRI